MSQGRHINPTELLDIMEKKRFGAEFQPIITTQNNEVFAYESLSRFYDKKGNSIPPDSVYSSLHDNPLSLFQVEYEQKKIQLAYAPSDVNLFVNLDQDSYSAPDAFDSSNPFVKLFNSYQKSEVIVELIENSRLSDAMMSLTMINNLAKNKIDTAIDDLFDPQSMLSTSVIQLVNYIKLDKYVLKNRHSKCFMALVNAMIGYAHCMGKKVILEGVETPDDLAFAKKIKTDFVQGFLFKTQFQQTY